MQRPSPDFPIDGRAARITRFPGWKPDVSRSSSLNPAGTPVISTPASYSMRDALEALLQEHLDVREVARTSLLSELEDDLLGAVDEIGDLALPLLAEPHDLLAGADEPAQSRHLLDDARVVLDVGCRRDERGELRDARLAAGGVELGALLELVDERDRIDGLALRPQRERRAVHLRVALAVEVGRVEDLADRADGDGREQHRAENRLLGFEILRRDDGAQALADPIELSVTRPTRESSRPGRPRPTGRWRQLPCRENRTYVPMLSPPADDLSTGRRELSSRKHALRARSSSRSQQGVWMEWIRADDAPASTSGRRRRARPVAPAVVRCRPSPRNHGWPRL